MRLANPYFLILIPVLLFLLFRKKKQQALPFSDVSVLARPAKGIGIRRYLGKIFLALSMISFCIALARPQVILPNTPIPDQGIDIALVLDVSESMASVDLSPNRLSVAKDTIEAFIKERTQDRLGLVVFSGSAYTRIPLTLDHDILIQSLEDVDTDTVSEEGTAIGMAESVGINRLKDSDSKSKVMILVTDGDNNAGSINPMTAAKLAKEMGVKIYTIGVGTDETIIPVQEFGQTTYQKVDSGLDEDLLTQVAETTGGSYFRAKDASTLDDVFEEINQLETSTFDQDDFKQYSEWAFPFMAAGLVLLLIGFYIERYRYIQIP